MDEHRTDLPFSSEFSPRAEQENLALPLEALIDQALATYTAAEPSADLAVRILAAAAPAVVPGAVVPSTAVAAPMPYRPLAWMLTLSGWLAAAAACLFWFQGHPLQIVLQTPVLQQQRVLASPPPSPMAALGSAAPVAHTVAGRPHLPRSGAALDPISIAPIQFAPIRFSIHPQERP